MSHKVYRNVVPFDYKGLQIRELTPEDMQGASIAEIEAAAGVSHPTARSSKCDKLYVCIEGAVSFQVEGKQVALVPRDVLFIPKNTWFSYKNETAETARLLLVHIPGFEMGAEEFRE
jgi:mannose-6-phosphate isomerase-like protein (cupin superfamily)